MEEHLLEQRHVKVARLLLCSSFQDTFAGTVPVQEGSSRARVNGLTRTGCSMELLWGLCPSSSPPGARGRRASPPCFVAVPTRWLFIHLLPRLCTLQNPQPDCSSLALCTSVQLLLVS